jgi:hypothetical protein
MSVVAIVAVACPPSASMSAVRPALENQSPHGGRLCEVMTLQDRLELLGRVQDVRGGACLLMLIEPATLDRRGQVHDRREEKAHARFVVRPGGTPRGSASDDDSLPSMVCRQTMRAVSIDGRLTRATGFLAVGRSGGCSERNIERAPCHRSGHRDFHARLKSASFDNRPLFAMGCLLGTLYQMAPRLLIPSSQPEEPHDGR